MLVQLVYLNETFSGVSNSFKEGIDRITNQFDNQCSIVLQQAHDFQNGKKRSKDYTSSVHLQTSLLNKSGIKQSRDDQSSQVLWQTQKVEIYATLLTKKWNELMRPKYNKVYLKHSQTNLSKTLNKKKPSSIIQSTRFRPNPINENYVMDTVSRAHSDVTAILFNKQQQQQQQQQSDTMGLSLFQPLPTTNILPDHHSNTLLRHQITTDGFAIPLPSAMKSKKKITSTKQRLHLSPEGPMRRNLTSQEDSHRTPVKSPAMIAKRLVINSTNDKNIRNTNKLSAVDTMEDLKCNMNIQNNDNNQTLWATSPLVYKQNQRRPSYAQMDIDITENKIEKENNQQSIEQLTWMQKEEENSLSRKTNHDNQLNNNNNISEFEINLSKDIDVEMTDRNVTNSNNCTNIINIDQEKEVTSNQPKSLEKNNSLELMDPANQLLQNNGTLHRASLVMGVVKNNNNNNETINISNHPDGNKNTSEKDKESVWNLMFSDEPLPNVMAESVLQKTEAQKDKPKIRVLALEKAEKVKQQLAEKEKQRKEKRELLLQKKKEQQKEKANSKFMIKSKKPVIMNNITEIKTGLPNSISQKVQKKVALNPPKLLKPQTNNSSQSDLLNSTKNDNHAIKAIGNDGKTLPLQICLNEIKDIESNKENYNNNNCKIKKPSLQKTQNPITTTLANVQENVVYAGVEKSVAITNPEPSGYEISDYDSDFSDSDLEEEYNGKYIPPWARSKEYMSVVWKQDVIDPEDVFGPMLLKCCDLEKIFRDFPQKPRYRKRSKSGDWSDDRVTWMEDVAYKKSMGWR